MAYLKEGEIRELIGRYESELSKLSYQATKVQEAILELKTHLGDSSGELAVATKTAFNQSSSVRQPVRKQSVAEVLRSNEEVDLPETGSGYRLSDWDYFILESLKEANMALVNSEFFKLAAKRIKEENINISRSQLHGKLNRSIHKLTHKRGILVKVSFAGKGFAYALSSWFDDNDKLLLKYKRTNFL